MFCTVRKGFVPATVARRPRAAVCGTYGRVTYTCVTNTRVKSSKTLRYVENESVNVCMREERRRSYNVFISLFFFFIFLSGNHDGKRFEHHEYPPGFRNILLLF